MSTQRDGVGLRWTQADGGWRNGVRSMWMSTQKVRVHWRHLVFFSCKEVGGSFHVDGMWMSTRGRGLTDNHIITKFASVVPYACMSVCTKFCKKLRNRPHLQKLHSNPWNIHTIQDICLEIHVKSLDNSTCHVLGPSFPRPVECRGIWIFSAEFEPWNFRGIRLFAAEFDVFHSNNYFFAENDLKVALLQVCLWWFFVWWWWLNDEIDD